MQPSLRKNNSEQVCTGGYTPDFQRTTAVSYSDPFAIRKNLIAFARVTLNLFHRPYRSFVKIFFKRLLAFE